MSFLGYKMRKHIAKALRAQSQAIRTAIDRFNDAAHVLDPSRAPLQWDNVIEFGFLAEFDLLQDTRQDVCTKPWAMPAGRFAMDLHFEILRAHEEIEQLNIEIRRLVTFICDKQLFLQQNVAEFETLDTVLAHHIRVYQSEQGRFTAPHLQHLQRISKLAGFSGSLDPGSRLTSNSVPERVGTHPECVGIHPERVGTHPERVGTHPEHVGTHPERVGTHPERVGIHPERVGIHPKHAGTHGALEPGPPSSEEPVLVPTMEISVMEEAPIQRPHPPTLSSVAQRYPKRLGTDASLEPRPSLTSEEPIPFPTAEISAMETVPSFSQPRAPILSWNYPKRFGTDGNDNGGNDDDDNDDDSDSDSDSDNDETVELACEALVQVLSITSD